MNPYLNANQSTVHPLAYGVELPFPMSVFRYIKVAAACSSCTLIHVQIEDKKLRCIFTVVLSETEKPETIIFNSIDQNTTVIQRTSNVSMLVSTGYLPGSYNVDCNIPVADICCIQAAPVSGYKTISIAANTYIAPSVLKLEARGQLTASHEDNAMVVRYMGQRPALQLCRQPITNVGYGVRSVNGISASTLIIRSAPEASGISLQQHTGSLVNTIFVRSTGSIPYGCSNVR